MIAAQGSLGPVGSLIIAGLIVAWVFLMFSMRKQIRKINIPPEESEPESREPDAERNRGSRSD